MYAIFVLFNSNTIIVASNSQYRTIFGRLESSTSSARILTFSTSLQTKVVSMLECNEYVLDDVVYISQFLNERATEYHAMWVYGSHYRCMDEVIGLTHVSFDSRVACVASQTCRASLVDKSLVEAALKYIGIVRNIIKVDYTTLKVNIMKYQWIKPNLVGSNRTMRQDEHGFWLIKDGKFQSHDTKPYIMLGHATQVLWLLV